MDDLPFMRSLLVAVTFLILVAAGGTVALATTPVAVDGDITALAGPAEGRTLASIAGSVGASGRGTAMLAPSGYASRAGYARGEEALLIRRRDGSILVLGGLGTKLTLAVSGRSFSATGFVATKIRARRTIPVEAQGLVLNRRARPARGQSVLVFGSPKGPIFDALRKRYRLVKFDTSRHSRAALLANPDAYGRVAGIVTDSSLRASDTDTVSELRALFNSGRWVAASPRAATLSKVMYPVVYAHFRGTQGALVRSADTGNGTRARKHLVVLEPRVHWVRTKYAQQVLKRGTPPPNAMKSVRASATPGLARSVARGELLGVRATKKSSKNELQQSTGVSTGAGTGSCNGTTTSGTAPAPAVYEICVNVLNSVVTSVPTLLNPWGFSGTSGSCLPNLGPDSWCSTPSSYCNTSGGGWTQGSGWNCGSDYGTLFWGVNMGACSSCGWMVLLDPGYPQTITQTSTVQFERVYSVSLAATGTGGFQQWVTETDGSVVGAVASAGSSQVQAVTGSTMPQVAPKMNYPTAYYCGIGSGNSCAGATTSTLTSQQPWTNTWSWEPTGNSGWGPPVNPQEAGFALGAALHLASFSYQPQAGQSASPTVTSSTIGTTPQSSDVTQNESGSQSGSSSYYTNTTNTAGWSISGNVDASCEAVDCEATGEASASISGGYSNVTTTSSGSSSTSSYSTSGTQTVTNWATSPYLGPAACSVPTASSGATTTQGPCSAWLLNSVWALENWTNYVPTLQFSGDPSLGSTYPVTCTGYGTTCFNNGSVTAQTGWGAGQNVNGLGMGSVATYQLAGSSSTSAAGGFVGTLTPNDEDTMYLVNQASPGPASTSITMNGQPGPVISPAGNQQAAVVAVKLANMGASSAMTCFGSCAQGGSSTTGPPPTLQSAFTVTGLLAPAGNQLAMSDLDLCAPPVVTAALWQKGCDSDPAYNSIPPQTWAPIPLCTNSSCAAGGTPLNPATAPPSGSTTSYPPYDLTIGNSVVCGPGSWSGEAPVYTYEWLKWTTSSGQNAWEPVTSGVSTGSPNTFTPPQGSAGGIYLCQVTAKANGMSTAVFSPSFTVIN